MTINVFDFYTVGDKKLTIREALQELQKVQPADVYKAAPKDFTDIDGQWSRHIFSQLFGPEGIGWTFDYKSEDFVLSSDEKKSGSSGRDYVLHNASIQRAEFRYAFTRTLDGEIEWSHPIICTGGSKNEDKDWAIKGAKTNAVNGGFAALGWQLPVYLGIVTHKNVRTFKVGDIPTFREHTATTATTTKPAAAAASAKPAAVAKPAIKADPATGEILEDEPTTPTPAAVAKPAAAAPKAAAPAPKPAAAASTTSPGDGAYIVPAAASEKWCGKSLDELAKSPKGIEALAYFARIATGGNSAKETLKNKAKAYLAAHPELQNA
jgi:hypothetical protein